MLLNLYGEAAKKRSAEYIKECYASVPVFSDISFNIVLNSSQEDLQLNFKLLQKVILLIEPQGHEFDRILEVYKRLINLDKKILAAADENLAIGYVELLGKFMITHIESCDKLAQTDFLWQYYHKFFELYMSPQLKKFKNFVKFFLESLKFKIETLVENLAGTTNILVNLGILSNYD
jgi:hypothetical protein